MSERRKNLLRAVPATSISVRIRDGKVVERIIRNERTAEEWAKLAKLRSSKPPRRPPPRDEGHQE